LAARFLPPLVLQPLFLQPLVLQPLFLQPLFLLPRRSRHWYVPVLVCASAAGTGTSEEPRQASFPEKPAALGRP